MGTSESKGATDGSSRLSAESKGVPEQQNGDRPGLFFLSPSAIDHHRGTGKFSGRSIYLKSAQISGVHVDNPSFFCRDKVDNSAFGEVLRLKSVCWLQIGGCFPSAPPGTFEVLVRLSLSNGPNFRGDWRIGTSVKSVMDFKRKDVDVKACNEPQCQAVLAETGVLPVLMRNDHIHGKGGNVLRNIFHYCCKGGGGQEQFALLSLGTLELNRRAVVNFCLAGGNSHWCSGLALDYLELRPLPISAEVKRVLLIGLLKEDIGDAGDAGCPLALLTVGILESIIGFLSTVRQISPIWEQDGASLDSYEVLRSIHGHSMTDHT